MEKKSIATVLLVAILVLGGILRFVTLDRELIFDDVFSIHYASLPAGDIMHYSASEVSEVPLYYLMLHGWIGMFGSGAVAAKMFSLLMSLGSILAMYFLGRLLFSKTVGLVASLLLSVSSIDILLSGDVRAYTLLIFLTIACVYHFWQYVRSRKLSVLVLFSACSVLAVYTHYQAWLVVLALNLFIFVFYKHHSIPVRQWLLAQVAVVLSFVPWILYSVIPNLRDGIFGTSWTNLIQQQYSRLMVFDMPLNFMLMPRFTDNAAFQLGILWYTLFFIAIVFAAVSFRRGHFTIDKQHVPERILLLVLLLIPLCAFFVFVVPVPKYYVVAAIPLYVIAAYGASSAVKKPAVLFGIGATALGSTLLFMPQLIQLAAATGAQEQAIAYIQSQEQDEDVILVHHYRARLFFDQHYTGTARVAGIYPKDDFTDLDYEIARFNSLQEPVITRDTVDVLQNMICSSNRIWLYASELTAAEKESGLRIREWLDDNGWRAVEPENSPYDFITLYERGRQVDVIR
ncbi:MAG: glycosyltransferase family 39 protein [Patescibacteria group bacterium]